MPDNAISGLHLLEIRYQLHVAINVFILIQHEVEPKMYVKSCLM